MYSMSGAAIMLDLALHFRAASVADPLCVIEAELIATTANVCSVCERLTL